jgi:fluoroquinolone transport system permease protein
MEDVEACGRGEIMKAIRTNFRQLILFLKNDNMMFAACFTPLLCALLFRFGVPVLERLVTSHFNVPYIITPYYGLFDLFLSVLSPTMFCYVAAMMILEEKDDRIIEYLFVTPLGKQGYLVSRLGVPEGISIAVTIILLLFFNLSQMSFAVKILLSAAGVVQGLIAALIIVTLSSNKLEGMAAAKLTSLMSLGIIAPFFLQKGTQYLLSPLPSFWMAKGVYENTYLYMILSFVLSFFWMGFLIKRFTRKTTG